MVALTAPPASLARPRRLAADPLLLVSALVALLLVAVAAAGSWLAPYDPATTDILSAGQGPTSAHLLGTDSIGRDILSRALVGARLSFTGPALIVLGSALIGTAIAIAGAWYGGWVDKTLNKITTITFAIPGVLVAVVAVAVFGSGFWAPVLALTLVYIPYIARVVRSFAVRQRALPYIEALELAGVPAWRICCVHILRNVAPIVLAQATIGFGSALVDFGAVSFLGLGVQAPDAEWGLMVAEGRSEVLDGAIQQSLTAGTFIVVTVVAFNILGERLTAWFGGTR
ncbi:ABC transporter permease [Streptomyces hydrogenans]|uniref:ABC transporter permease n=1 Tax=Streptomyces hydrogenans TaxID=1873719 RepID=UPI003432247F